MVFDGYISNICSYVAISLFIVIPITKHKIVPIEHIIWKQMKTYGIIETIGTFGTILFHTYFTSVVPTAL